MFDPVQQYTQQIEADVAHILTLLSTQRKAGTKEEEAFVVRHILPLADHPNATQFTQDEYGNVFIEVCGGSDKLFTAHTDMIVIPNTKQEVLYDANLQVAYTSGKCTLGADDGAGMWLLMELLKAGVPCWLAFFREEEIGGRGSSFASTDNPEFFKSFTHCISFDRRGTGDVITHQSWGRCCSDELAAHLSRALNAHGLDYAPCDGGVFTDSANFTDLIAECLNLSVGYNHEHHANEELDVDHLLRLRDAVVKIDWTTMPVKREPGEEDFKYDHSWLNYRSFSGFDRDVAPFDRPKTPAWSTTTTRKPTPAIRVEDLYDMNHEDLVDAMWEDPQAMADAIWDLLWGDAQPIDFDPEDGIN